MLAEPKRTHLNRALSKLGWCSRGIADAWIAEGRVSVNGIKAKSSEQWIELGRDRIDVKGGPSTHPESPRPDGASLSKSDLKEAAKPKTVPPSGQSSPVKKIYLQVNKPAGYVTTRSDELGRKTVYDLLAKGAGADWIFPVGRLDKDSEGLLLMTNDGEWANLLTDPEFHVDKEYRVKLDGKPREEELERFRSGVMLEGKSTLPAEVDAEGTGWYRVVIREGRNRQIRRMFHALGYKVKRLVRLSIGPLRLGDLAVGEARPVEPRMVEALRKAPRAKKSK